jgi:hypothetical protein
MTHSVHILIDFENVQPSAEELASIRGSRYRVRLFHGPHQNKFDAAVAKALQPLGEQVEYIQCGRNGKNALDFHIAFYLGRAVQAGDNGGGAGADRYMVVSKDAGFDALLEHLRLEGYRVARVPNVDGALEAGRAIASPSAPPPPTAPASPRPPSSKSPPETTATPTNGPVPDPRSKILDNLRAHPRNRPATRDALVRHVGTLLGNKPTPKAVEALIAALERDGIVAVANKKIEYSIPKTAK